MNYGRNETRCWNYLLRKVSLSWWLLKRSFTIRKQINLRKIASVVFYCQSGDWVKKTPNIKNISYSPNS